MVFKEMGTQFSYVKPSNELQSCWSAIWYLTNKKYDTHYKGGINMRWPFSLPLPPSLPWLMVSKINQTTKMCIFIHICNIRWLIFMRLPTLKMCHHTVGIASCKWGTSHTCIHAPPSHSLAFQADSRCAGTGQWRVSKQCCAHPTHSLPQSKCTVGMPHMSPPTCPRSIWSAISAITW